MKVNHLPWVLDEWLPAERIMRTRRTYVREGAVREVEYDVRMYMREELRDVLHGAGFSHVEPLGATGKELTIDDRRVVAVARACAVGLHRSVPEKTIWTKL